MAEWLKIPLIGGSQEFDTELNGVQVTIAVLWRDGDGAGWFMDVDGVDGKPYAHGVPLIVGSNLLAGLEYLGLGELRVRLSGNESRPLTYDDLGQNVTALYWRLTNG